MRQIDLTPTVLNDLDLCVGTEEKYEGKPADLGMEPQLLLAGPRTEQNRIWAGIRSEKYKIIRSYNLDWVLKKTEVYDVQSDPNEKCEINIDEIPQPLINKLNSFIKRSDIQEPLRDWHPEVGFPDNNNVEDRLKNLGYLN
jgi:hypothetical protein